VNNPADLRATRALVLLQEIQQCARDFHQKEAAIAKESRIRGRAIEHEHQQALETIENRYHQRKSSLENQRDERLADIQLVAANRQKRLDQARQQFEFELPRRVRSEKERWMGLQQHLHMEAGRNLTRAREALSEEQSTWKADFEAATQEWQELHRGAVKAFRGIGFLKRKLEAPAGDSHEPPPHDSTPSRRLAMGRDQIARAWIQLSHFEKQPLGKLFRYFPLLAWIILAILAGGALGFRPNADPAWIPAASVGGGLVLLAFLLHAVARTQCSPPGLKVIKAIQLAAATLESAGTLEQESRAAREAHLQADYDETCARIQQDLDRTSEVVDEFQQTQRERLETKVPRITARIEDYRSRAEAAAQAEYERGLASLEETIGDANARLEDEFGTKVSRGTESEQSTWQQLIENWQTRIEPLYREVGHLSEALAVPSWKSIPLEPWQPPKTFTPSANFGQLKLDLRKIPDALPESPELALPGSPRLQLPAALTFPEQGSLLLETEGPLTADAVKVLNTLLLRLLNQTPPGKIAFTLIEPVSLGQSFAGLMHLADYEESIINRRIWTQRDQIEQRLADLSEHIEKVIQMYLRNEFDTITAYNEKAGSVAEKFHFLVITDFPAAVSDSAAADLKSILSSGPRCGVYTLIHRDTTQSLPDGLSLEDLHRSTLRLFPQSNRWWLEGMDPADAIQLALDSPPEPALSQKLIDAIGQASVDSTRVEVPFRQIAPAEADLWTLDTVNELKIPIGRSGASKLQYLAIGKGTRQHALFAGKTGSGKSTLFHVIITNLALAASPDQVEFYLIDFKKGVEFKAYASRHLPHARVVAIESDREFALSVLQRVDEELKRRGDLFRKLGVQDLAGYHRAGGTEPMPRVLLLIDEFQEFFVEEDTVAQNAALLFDRIVRQGRAFGIHVLLGSQTLGGAYSLARATLGQMAIRVALQCNEADAYLIMDENNPAPRLLSRPGEGIYNDAGGAVEGNSPFQVVWLPEEERDHQLEVIQSLARARGFDRRRPIVFEGNAPADPADNLALTDLLAQPPTEFPGTARIWLGAPNAIKGPTEIALQNQSGQHTLIIGQNAPTATNLLGLAILALAAQHPPDMAHFHLLRSGATDSAEAKWLKRILDSLPHPARFARLSDLEEVMSTLADEQQRRIDGEVDPVDAPRHFLLIDGLHQFKKLRQEDQFAFDLGEIGPEAKPSAQFLELINEGSTVGMHILASIDTLNNINRSLSRKALSEFAIRVLFQMSANDSATLIDNPKAAALGLHRALLYNEIDGTLETFRPYGDPDGAWFDHALGQLETRKAEPVRPD